MRQRQAVTGPKNTANQNPTRSLDFESLSRAGLDEPEQAAAAVTSITRESRAS